MRFRTEIREGEHDEIVIICSERNDKIKHLERVIENALGGDAEMILTLGETEYFVPKREILFFETSDGRVTAHTRGRMYYAPYTLFGLERILPDGFTFEGGKRAVYLDEASPHDKTPCSTVNVKINAGEKVEAVNRIVLEIVAEGRPTAVYVPIVLLG